MGVVTTMRDFLTDFYLVNRGGGHGGVLSVTQGDEKCIAIMIDKGLTRDEIFLTPNDARDLVNALRRELHREDGDA